MANLETRVLEEPLQIEVGMVFAGEVPKGFYKERVHKGAGFFAHLLEIPAGTEIWTDVKDLETLRLPLFKRNLLANFSRLWVKHEGSIYQVAPKKYGEGDAQNGFQSIQSTWGRISGTHLAKMRRFNSPFPQQWFPHDNGGSIYNWPNWTWQDGTLNEYK